MRSKTTNSCLAAITILATASIASAHPGHAMHNAIDGLTHPLTGVDHLLAMVAVGVWAALQPGRRVWLVPMTFVSMLIVGLCIGRFTGAGSVNELFIAVSVIAVGGLIASGRSLPIVWACAIAGVFAMFHGLSHGAEIPAGVSAWQFGMGMIVSTALLHAAGVSIGSIVRRSGSDSLLRLGGAAVAGCGVLIATGAM